MNKYSCLLLSGLMLSSCIDLNKSPENDKIAGKWEWLNSAGGITGHVITPETEGYNIYLHLTKNYELLRIQADTILYNGKYLLEKKSGETKLIYLLSGSQDVPPQIVDFRGRDTLILRDECTDCYVNTFARIKDDQ